jgi:hypothetical protein
MQQGSYYSICIKGALVLVGAVVLAACGTDAGREAAVAESDLPYAAEYPAMAYGTRRPGGSLGRLADRTGNGATELRRHPVRGYLDAMLAELDIDVSSQVLVFSRTSVQTRGITPETPRAIYFDDENYVAWSPGAPLLELAGFDPELGPVFYTLPQNPAADSAMSRELANCLRCHDTYSLTGGGVPRFLLGSGYIGTDGELVSHEAWILTSQATALRFRWGGWYVTGRHGDQVHLGNIVVQQAEDLQDLEALRIGNIDELSALFDTSNYLTPYSDIVALMVLEHQVEVQNLISRLHFEAAAGNREQLDEHVEALVEAMLMADEIVLTDEITGSSGFAQYFEALGPFDSDGRSLRQFDLQSRLFRYPLSYLIYSDGFAALPDAARSAVYGRLRDVLAGSPDQDGRESLSLADRSAIGEILGETLPELFSF